MLARWLVLGSASVGALALVVACTKFETDGVARDASTDAAMDAAPVSPGLCVPPPPTGDPEACSACDPIAVFGDTKCEAVIVAEGKLFALSSGILMTADNLETGVLASKSAAPIALGPFRMGLDGQYVYVATNDTIQRFPRTGGDATSVLPASFAAPEVGPVFFGNTRFVQLQPNSLVSAPFDGSDAGVSSLMVNSTAGLALDGDTAYWLGRSSTGSPILLGAFPTADDQSAVSQTVLGFAVHGALAFVAEPGETGDTSVLSRITLRPGGDGTRDVLAIEPGRIESVHASGNRVYWVANRDDLSVGRVFMSVDICGGEVKMHSKLLPPLAANLSFSGDWAYFASTKPGPIYRMKR